MMTEAQRKYQAVNAAMEANPNLTLKEACKNEDLNISTYAYRRKRDEGKPVQKPKKSHPTNLPVMTAEQLEKELRGSHTHSIVKAVILMGDAESVMTMIRGMN